MGEKDEIYSNSEVVKRVVDFCLDKYKFVFISGNGGSGKTTFSKKIIEEINSRGMDADCIDTDDFMIDTDIRKKAIKEWVDVNNNKRISDHGSVFQEAYYLDSLNNIVNSLLNNQSYSYKPKKKDEFVNLNPDTSLIIVEGIASAFLEKNSLVFSVLITCDLAIEVNRRIERARNGEDNMSREDVEKKCSERREQFEVTVLNKKDKFDLELYSLENHSFAVKKDSLDVLN